MSSPRQVGFSRTFVRHADRLSKKYRHIHNDVDEFVEKLENGETPGNLLQGTGEYIVYKARVASSDMQRGKSGGFRVAYYLQTDTYAYLLIIYPKAERDNLSPAEVMKLIQEVLEELADEETDSPDTDTPPEA
jgi:mRNA-degrading endonuclease RelE of RelBE toxin-antitoxin system